MEPVELQQLVGITVGDIPSDAEVIPVIGDSLKDGAKDSSKESGKQSKDKEIEGTKEKAEPGSPTSR